MAKSYTGIDLHSTSMRLCVVGENRETLLEKTIKNDLALVLETLEPFGPGLDVAVESCFNWYWLGDGLQDAGHRVHLVHTLGLYMITRAKVKTDRRDARTLAVLLASGMLPEGYIYPKETRPIRDLVRQRTRLVAARARGYASLRAMLYRHGDTGHSRNAAKAMGEEDIGRTLPEGPVRLMAAQDLQRISLLSEQIGEIEGRVLAAASPESGYQALTSIPGFGKALSAIVFYETGDVGRFKTARNYSSFCRLVPGTADSGGSSKRGRGSKQGNPHLKSAFTQAAQCAVRHYPRMKEFYDRQVARHPGRGSKLIATCILGHRLAQAAYHILKEGVPFDDKMLFEQ